MGNSGRWVMAAAVLAGMASLAVAAPTEAAPAGSAVVAAGSWGKAIEIPGLGALDVGGGASVLSVSCAPAGNCAVGGSYSTDGSENGQGFVVSDRNGRWANAIEVPGLGALNTGGEAYVVSVSCGSEGNCLAVGNYIGSGRRRAFVASEVNGLWRTAVEVPGLRALSANRNAYINSVSCASAGNCAAGGSYSTGGSGTQQGFVVSERSGHWGKAIAVPGLRALTKGRYGNAAVLTVSCGSAGNCAADGVYSTGPTSSASFVVSDWNGRWGTAIEVPGLRALSGGRMAGVLSVSCAPADYCAADGGYTDSSGQEQSFALSERNGRWGKGVEIQGPHGTRTGSITPVSCASPGNCAIGGTYADGAGHGQAFVVSELNGRWGKAIQVPGLPTTVRSLLVESVSCGSAGNCALGGSYRDSSGLGHAFVVDERNGRWGKAMQVPGLGTLNHRGPGQPDIMISCASAGCAAAGVYFDGSGNLQSYVVSEQNG